MFIVNVEGAVKKNDKWLIIERGVKEAHAGESFLLLEAR
jgi:8-oxo-dGTP diphosphatase